MKSLLIAGGGKFGEKALEFAKVRNYHTIIIDKNPDCLASKYVHDTFNKFEGLLDAYRNSTEPKLFLLLHDISIINKILLKTEITFEYIIPVVPIHLTALIIKTVLKDKNYELLPDEDLCSQSVPNLNKDILLNHNCENGVIYLSYAREDEICPDNCSGPPNYCPTFNREKPITITEYIKNFFKITDTFNLLKKEGRLIISIHSQQLRPGLGGLKAANIYYILTEISNNLKYIKRNELKIIIGTSCNCHGVINFFKSLNSSN